MTTALSDTLDGIPYKELKGSNIISGGPGRLSAQRMFRTNWSDRLQFAIAMVGRITLGSDGSTVITYPKQHPDIHGLFASDYHCEPYHSESRIVAKTALPETDDAIDYDFAKVTIRYEAANGSFSGGGNSPTLITEEVNISAQMLSIPGEMFYYYPLGGPPEPVELSVGILVGTVEDSIVFHKSSTNKRAIVKSLVGSVNNAVFADSPSGSVLFMGAQSHRSVTTDGIQFWELKYTFKTRVLSSVSSQQDSWQKIFKQNAGWRAIVRQHDTTLFPYPYGDFTQLFS